ncbi:4-coumarate--CoA ligase-like 7 [Sphaceloma murrayae]|uniref:4-coumarate--CoA ligase-like 7 n=1 Tax=Sphaceloma murrayae TaxID=2082308 RepID=A0A2K1R1G1_9PEZI|nr:4-coumarate--CoA ligase-like 7 [Sphaceloma murrayae]
MDANGILHSEHYTAPCYQDLVSFTIGHTNYDPNTPILIDVDNPNNFVTLLYARHFVRSLIGSLKHYGVGPGHTVCLHMYNHILFPLLFLAVVGTGAQVTAANPAYTAAELKHHYIVSGATFVVSCNDKIKLAKEAAIGIPALEGEQVFWVAHWGFNADIDLLQDGWHPTLENLVDYTENGYERDWVTFDDAHLAQTTTACFNSTSGTTGLSKMAARSHHSLVMENLSIEDRSPKDYQVKRLLCTPFFHGFTLPLAVVSALRLGIPTYVMHRFDQAKFLDAVGKFGITETAMPPPMLVRFLATEPRGRMQLRSLHKVWSGGAVLATDTQCRALDMFAQDARICQVWGMTEGGWMTTFNHPVRDNSGSVGRLIGTYEACIMPNDGSSSTPIRKTNTAGEIWVRGPINMIEYRNNRKATDEIMTPDRWLRTGDIGHIDDEGRIFVVDRMKELIKVRGWQVSPSEMEARLLAHPDIVDAGVIGIPKPELASEVPRAYVVLRQPGLLDQDDVRAHLLATLAKFKVGDTEVHFVDSIPKNPSGKILRRLLREAAAKEGSAEPNVPSPAVHATLPLR